MNATLMTERLPRTLQKLVDARLDTIDRMLLGRLPRADRLAVARDVESQIFELLGDRPGRELDREDVLTVLSQLDPPEAYIPEEGGYEATAVLLPSAGVAATRRSAPREATALERKQATVMGIIGLLVFGLMILWPATYIFAMVARLGEIALFVLLGLSAVMLIASVPTLVLSILWRRGGGWAVVGMVAGGMGLLVAPAYALVLVLLG